MALTSYCLSAEGPRVTLLELPTVDCHFMVITTRTADTSGTRVLPPYVY